MSVGEWDWSLRVFDHVQVHASDYRESVRFYETVLAALGVPRLAEHDDWTDFTDLASSDGRTAGANSARSAPAS